MTLLLFNIFCIFQIYHQKQRPVSKKMDFWAKFWIWNLRMVFSIFENRLDRIRCEPIEETRGASTFPGGRQSVEDRVGSLLLSSDAQNSCERSRAWLIQLWCSFELSHSMNIFSKYINVTFENLLWTIYRLRVDLHGPSMAIRGYPNPPPYQIWINLARDCSREFCASEDRRSEPTRSLIIIVFVRPR